MWWSDLGAWQYGGIDQSEARIRILLAKEPHPKHFGDEPNYSKNIPVVHLEFQKSEELEWATDAHKCLCVAWAEKSFERY